MWHGLSWNHWDCLLIVSDCQWLSLTGQFAIYFSSKSQSSYTLAPNPLCGSQRGLWFWRWIHPGQHEVGPHRPCWHHRTWSLVNYFSVDIDWLSLIDNLIIRFDVSRVPHDYQNGSVTTVCVDHAWLAGELTLFWHEQQLKIFAGPRHTHTNTRWQVPSLVVIETFTNWSTLTGFGCTSFINWQQESEAWSLVIVNSTTLT